MTLTRRAVLVAMSATAAMAALPAFAETVVKVSLWDNPDKDMMTGLGHGMGGDMSTANMGITAAPASAPAGVVTFDVTNDSKDIIHEMIVAPLKSKDELLTYMPDKGKVDEDAGLHLGEVAELEPGTGGKLSLTLKAGHYILYCNIAGHYMAGMWTLFEVK